MTRDETLAEVARLHLEWTNRVAQDVPTNIADQKPTGRTDYPEHHQDISATPRQEQDYLAAVAALLGGQESASRSRAHVLVNGICTRCTPSVQRNFNPSEPRIPGGEHGGEWGVGGAAGSALKDTLKLAGKIDLGPDEKLVGSAKLLADDGTIRMALTETHGVKSLRLGIGGRGFGSREDEAGPWRGSDNTTATNIEQKKLRDEEQSLTAEWNKLDADPHADPARKAAVDKRLGELANVNTSDIHASGYTASLDQRAVQQLRSTLAKAATDGAAHEKQVNADWDRSEELDRQLNELDAIPSSSDKWTPELKAKYAALLTERQDLAVKIRAQDWTILAEGSIPGQGGDVHYRVDFDDPTQGVGTYVGVIPHGSGLEFTDLTGNEMAASLDPAETKKFLTLLGKYSA